MAETFLLELVTPERRLLSEQVGAVYAPGAEGEFGVLPGHAPLLCLLRIGELRYSRDGEDRRVAISGGFAEVDQKGMRVLAETAEFAEEIDVERAERAQRRAENRLKKLDIVENADEFAKAELALKRALIRLHVAGR
jgi:F-type H+-transporting ATPase subunit epsilon